MSVRRNQIRETVEALLSDSKIRQGPVPVEKIAKSPGVTIKLDTVDDDLSGFLYRDKAGEAVIGVNKSHHPNRRRFTIAHELGHFLLHEGELVHVDQERASFTVDFRNRESARGENDSEKEANLFAAELLMPEKFLREELAGQRLDIFDDGDVLERLANKYEVSVQALTFRLGYLNYITL
jgi:Zn-dependent peptidase ImmA (M78 family)